MDEVQPSIEDLNLRCCSLNSSGVVQMFEAVTCRGVLKKLNLAWNEIGSLGGQTIATVLLTPECILVELDLRDNRLGDSVSFATKLRDLSNADARNNHLERLHLGNNRLCEESASALASSLSAFTVLQDLALYGNPLIGSEGSSHIAQAFQFKKVPNLQILNLSMCDLGDLGARGLFDSLVNNSALRELDLSQNSVSDKSVNSIIGLFSSNKILEILDLSFNSMTTRALGFIEQVKKSASCSLCIIRLHANPCAAHARETGQTYSFAEF
jgi:hypothetical protein